MASLALLSLALPLALLLAHLLPRAHAHSYHMGKCPVVPPMADFSISRFLGRWHVLQKTSTRVRCLTNEYAWAEGEEQRQKKGGRSEWDEELREGRGGERLSLLQRMQLPLPAVNNGVRYAGALTADADPARAAAFTARFPLNILGSASYVVFDTDYDTYAGVVSCQKIALFHRLSASIMARGHSLPPQTMHKLRSQLTSLGVKVANLNVIRQTCDEADEEKGVQLHIKPNVFRSNATRLLEDANDAVATAADTARRVVQVYNAVNGVVALGEERRRREASAEDAEDYVDDAAPALPDPADWMP